MDVTFFESLLPVIELAEILCFDYEASLLVSFVVTSLLLLLLSVELNNSPLYYEY
jgi:hypothetical protein